MDITVIVALVLIVLMLYSITKEVYHIRRDIYWWRDDWETMHKISIQKKSLKEQADIIKKIIASLDDTV